MGKLYASLSWVVGGETVVISCLSTDGISGTIKEEDDTEGEGFRSKIVVVGTIPPLVADIGMLELVDLETSIICG